MEQLGTFVKTFVKLGKYIHYELQMAMKVLHGPVNDDMKYLQSGFQTRHDMTGETQVKKTLNLEET